MNQTGHKSLVVLRGYVRRASVFEDNAAASFGLGVLEDGGLFWAGTWGGSTSEGVWDEDWYEPKRF